MLLMKNHEKLSLLLQGQSLIQIQNAPPEIASEDVAPFTLPKERSSPLGLVDQQVVDQSGVRPWQQLRWSGFSGQPPSLTSEAGHRP